MPTSRRHSALLAIAVTVLVTLALAPRAHSRAAPDDPPGLAAIREADLRRDMEVLAGDGMRGREAGTLDELRASAWLAERARAAGLEPAGDDGTYFQFWPMRRTLTAPASVAAVDGAPLPIGTDAIVVFPTDATIDASILVVPPGTTPAADVARGRVLAIALAPPTGPAPGAGREDAFIYTLLGVLGEAQRLAPLHPAAIVVVADSIAEHGFPFARAWMLRGDYAIDSAGTPSGAAMTYGRGVPILFTRQAVGARVAHDGARFTASLAADRFMQPSVNVIARLRGTDPRLRDEWVLFSAHQDHDGVRFPVRGDSIWNGADDNASTSVALLAIGRAWKAHPGKRSALFIWHGSEERGLLGSKWHAAHPVVPLTSIAAVLNGDMIGRNNPDTASLLGAQPPHRNSSALVRMALAANARVSHFAIDTIWDRPNHPEGFYYRSDHVPYAARGVPAVFFTTVLHDIYHTPFDEPSRIDYAKLTRMTRWMYATGWTVANAAERPRVDPGFVFSR